MAIYVVYNGTNIPLTNVGSRNCAFIINSDEIPGADGDVITGFNLVGNDLTITTDGSGPWTVDLSSLTTNFLLPVNPNPGIAAGFMNVMPGGPQVTHVLPDPTALPDGTLIGIQSNNGNTVEVDGGGTINGDLSYNIADGESLFLTSYGSNWIIVSNYIDLTAPVPTPLSPLERVVVGDYLTAPATIGAAVLATQINTIDAKLGRVYINLPTPDVLDGGVPAGTVLVFRREGEYPIMFTGSTYLGGVRTGETGISTQYPMRGSDMRLVAVNYEAAWRWMVEEYSQVQQLSPEVGMVNIPINSVVGYTDTLYIARTPESGGTVLYEGRNGQEIAVRLPALFSQPISSGTQLFLSPDTLPIIGSDVPYIQAEPWDVQHPNIYIGHVVRAIGNGAAPAGINYTSWANERENYVVRLTDERDYINRTPMSVRLLDGVTTWFRYSNIIPSTVLTLTNLANDIETLSSDIVDVPLVYWYNSLGDLQVYDHVANTGGGNLSDVWQGIVGVQTTIISGKADYRRHI